ncbi:phosphoinositide 3-kinase regulatory subunit 4-like [Patella vulgata]|uniref:phosphoinositide 3-kinase regulatory subunit 4-like n=1 Tax=Patella vulgata TaxID=6465 RepID=UPI0024A9DBF7|nr:phosphoinositide 3-kinase regulatory subunit 4-like [Patella vulgata]
MRNKAVKNIDVDTYGNITDITHFDTGSQSILTYSTVNGYIVGWDLRSPEPTWKLKNEPRAGLITSFAVHQTQCWLAAGTSNGTHICWDMRFQLRIGLNTIQHPAQARVRRLIMHPHEQSLILSAPQWNNEVSMWDVETGSRQKVLWASKSPPLSLNQTNNHAIHGMHIASTDQKIFLLTAGTDMTIRYWDLATPSKSFIMSHPATEYTNTAVSYQSQLIDGTDVVQEVYNRKQTSSEDIPHRGPEAPSTAHHNMISDIGICQSSQCLVITASRDGVIKLWK